MIDDLNISVFKQDTQEEDTECKTLEAVAASAGPCNLGEGLDHLEVGSSSCLQIVNITSSQSLEGFFFLLAEDGRILYMSENVDKFIGYSQIDVMGHPIYNFTHPADLAKIQATLSGGRRSLS